MTTSTVLSLPPTTKPAGERPRTAPPRALPKQGETSRTLALAYYAFLAATACVLLRPAELVPELKGLPIFEVAMVASLLLSINAIRDLFFKSELYKQPVTVCVGGLLIAVSLSHLTHAYLGGAVDSTLSFAKVLLYFLVLTAVIDTPQRLWGLIRCITISSCLMVSLCVIDYVGIVDLEYVQHFVQRNEGPVVEGYDDTGDEPPPLQGVIRMRGTGVFEDPNDISLLIVGTLVLCAFYLTDKRSGPIRFAWLVPMGILFTGLLFTRSRGGLLACGAAGMVYMMLRYGGTWSFVMAGLGACAMPFIGGRQGEIDLEGGTGQERIQMWAEGLAELKSPNILFGIGQGGYADIAGLVAHNSFVHAYVELGLFGGTFFFGCFFFIVLGLYRIYTRHPRIKNPELVRFYPFLCAMLGGWMTGLFSLSRCYVIPTYMTLGIATTYLQLVGTQSVPPRLLIAWNGWHRRWLVLGSIGALGFLYVFVKIFARF